MNSQKLSRLSKKLQHLIDEGQKLVDNSLDDIELKTQFPIWRNKCTKALIQADSYAEVELKAFKKILFHSPIGGVQSNETWLFPGIKKALGLLSLALEDIEDDLQNENFDKETRLKIERDPRSVFVIHGQNRAAYTALEEFLTSIDLKVVDWSKAISYTGKPSPYIGETVLAGLDNAMAIIALFSDDESVKLRESLSKGREDSGFQPRPNVIFEAGIAFGRHSERMVFVQVGELRDMSDIAGIHCIRMSQDHQIRADLITRLKSLGCKVDDSNGKWVKAGDFEASVAHPKP